MNHAQCSWPTPKRFTISTAKFPLNAMATSHISAFKRISPMSFAVEIRTIKFYTRGQQSEEVPHFQRHAAWSADTASGSLAQRNGCSDVNQQKALQKRPPLYRRISPTEWSRTAAARNIKAQTLRHPVSGFKLFSTCQAWPLSIYQQKKVPLYSREFSDEAAEVLRRLKRIPPSSRHANGSTPRPFICRVLALKRWIIM